MNNKKEATPTAALLVLLATILVAGTTLASPYEELQAALPEVNLSQTGFSQLRQGMTLEEADEVMNILPVLPLPAEDRSGVVYVYQYPLPSKGDSIPRYCENSVIVTMNFNTQVDFEGGLQYAICEVGAQGELSMSW